MVLKSYRKSWIEILVRIEILNIGFDFYELNKDKVYVAVFK